MKELSAKPCTFPVPRGITVWKQQLRLGYKCIHTCVSVHLLELEDELKNVKVQQVKRVIGGETFEEGKWPWLVSLQGQIPEITVRLLAQLSATMSCTLCERVGQSGVILKKKAKTTALILTMCWKNKLLSRFQTNKLRSITVFSFSGFVSFPVLWCSALVQEHLLRSVTTERPLDPDSGSLLLTQPIWVCFHLP